MRSEPDAPQPEKEKRPPKDDCLVLGSVKIYPYVKGRGFPPALKQAFAVLVAPKAVKTDTGDVFTL